MKRITVLKYEQLSALYLYGYQSDLDEDDVKSGTSRRLTPSNTTPDAMDVVDDEPPRTSDSGALENQDSSMDVTSDGEGLKRKGPDTRTVVLGPEAKRSRINLVFSLLYSDRIISKCQHNLIGLYWMMRRVQTIAPDPSALWWQCSGNSAMAAMLDLDMQQTYHTDQSDLISITNAAHLHHSFHCYLFAWPGKTFQSLYTDLQTCEVYKVDDEADNISEEQCYDIWEQVEQADEIKQFVDTGSFQKIHVNSLTDDVVIVDALWVRKWKRLPSGGRKVKSRLCARGCFDP